MLTFTFEFQIPPDRTGGTEWVERYTSKISEVQTRYRGPGDLRALLVSRKSNGTLVVTAKASSELDPHIIINLVVSAIEDVADAWGRSLRY